MNELVQFFLPYTKVIETSLQDVNTFYTTLLSIAISVATLLFSIAMGKRDELKIVSETIKLGDTDPINLAMKGSLINYIRRLRTLLNKCLIVIIVSLAACVFSWIALRFGGISSKLIVASLLGISAIITTIYIAHILYKLGRVYQKEMFV